MTKLLLPLVICFALFSDCCGPCPQPRRTVVALIFCDVTNSLTKEENGRTSAIAANIVDNLPDGAVFKIYPILVQTQLPSHIPLDVNADGKVDEKDYTVPEYFTDVEARKNATADEENKVRRRQQLRDGIDKLYDQLNKGPDNRSCIVNVLGFTSNKFLTEYRDADKYDLRLYLISDMVEECNVTPLANSVVEMDKQDISAEIKRATEFKTTWDLSRVKIYCLFPSASDTPLVRAGRRPSREHVKVFWNAIFRGCGIDDEAFRRGQVEWHDSAE